MSTDTVRMVFTYAAALLILAGCFVLLVIQSQVPPEQLLPFVTGIVGVVIGFLFNRESTTAGARASERSVALGQSAGPGGTVVTGDNPRVGPNDTVNVPR